MTGGKTRYSCFGIQARLGFKVASKAKEPS